MVRAVFDAAGCELSHIEACDETVHRLASGLLIRGDSASLHQLETAMRRKPDDAPPDSSSTAAVRSGFPAPLRREWTHHFIDVIQGSVGSECLGAADRVAQLQRRLAACPPPATRLEQAFARGLLWEWATRAKCRFVSDAPDIITKLLNDWSGPVVPRLKATPNAVWLTLSAGACYGRRTGVQLAHDVGLSRTEFYLAFKSAAGEAPHHYLEACRVKHAQQELLSRDTKIDAIASMLGYRTYATFYRSFRKIVGRSPEEFRRSATDAIRTECLRRPMQRCPLLESTDRSGARCTISR